MEYSTCKIRFLKTKNENEIEQFFIKLKEEIRSLPEGWDVEFTLNREFFGSVIGSWAGIIITVLLGLPPCILSTIKLWTKIINQLKALREKGENPRIANLFFFENIARHELFKRGFNDVSLKDGRLVGIPGDEIDEFEEIDDANLERELRAILTFKADGKIIIYEIMNDGDILKVHKEKEE